jgi:hypothetical protein
VPITEIVEGRLRVPFFAGKFVGGGAGVAGVEFAKGEIVQVLDDGLAKVSHKARGTEMVGVREVGGAVFVFSDKISSHENVLGGSDLPPIFRAQRDMIFGFDGKAGGCVEVKTWRRGSIAKWR